MKTVTSHRDHLMSIFLLSALIGCGGAVQQTGPSPPPPSPTPQGSWIWMSGTPVVDQPGNYGEKGVPSPSNVPPGRAYPASWTDVEGKLWLFGGYSYAEQGDLNDLWEYTNGQWIWMSGSSQVKQAGAYGTQGIASPTNVPGARAWAMSWSDQQGNFWLFGGNGFDSTGTAGLMNDLWKYSNGEWTWISGSSLEADPGVSGAWQGAGAYGTRGVATPENYPGARTAASTWVDDSGNLWLFGGNGVDANGQLGSLDDLWEFSKGEWTWVGGSSLIDQNGVWGTKGVASSENIPSPRTGAATWVDAQGNLWLFGGSGPGANNCQASTPPCELSDLWEYSNGEWTWMGGSNLNNQPGVYGNEGAVSPTNTPPPRDSAVTWTDSSGNFWMFGGSGPNAVNYNDLWEYSEGAWAWMNGSNSPCSAGSYAIQNYKNVNNSPSARTGGVGWVDKSGNLWFFGGEDLCNRSGTFNDLWEYLP